MTKVTIMYEILNLNQHFGFRREGGGRVVYLFNGEIDYAATEQVTDKLYNIENENGDIDFSEYEPSVLDTNAIGEIEDELPIRSLIELLDTAEKKMSVLKFFEQELWLKYIPLIYVDVQERKIKPVDHKTIEPMLNDLVNYNLLIREYDHLEDY